MTQVKIKVNEKIKTVVHIRVASATKQNNLVPDK